MFWDQFLKLELAATAPNSDEQKQAKDEAYSAIRRLRSEAERELQFLAWNDNIRHQIQKQHPGFIANLKFIFVPGKPPRRDIKFTWYLNIAYFWLWLLFALLFGALYLLIVLRNPNAVNANAAGVGILIAVLSIVAGYHRFKIEQLKNPRPDRSFLNEI